MAQFALKDNPLTEDPNDRIAQVIDIKSYSKDDVIERAAAHGNVVSKIDMKAALDAVEEEILRIHEEGSTVNLPLFSTSISISGVFVNADDTFDPKRHAVKINAAAGSALKATAKKIKFTKVKLNPAAPLIENVFDTFGDENTPIDTVQAGSVIAVTGARLKFDPKDSEQGVFLLSGETVVRLGKAVENLPQKLSVMLPADTPAGTYSVEVRTKIMTKSDKSSKILKTGIFDRTITVKA